MESNDEKSLIVKRILHPGKKFVAFENGSRVTFHFQTRICDPSRTLIDDSKTSGTGKPMQLVLGKKFKLEVWEAIVQKMAIDEVASFVVDKSLVSQYPFVSKTLREAALPPGHRKSHCCAMTLQQEGLGHVDLNDLLKNPTDLEFTIELLQIERPGEYLKDSWQLNESEQLGRIHELKSIGNEHFGKKAYDKASETYAEAIALIDQLVIREKPDTEEWHELNKLKIPYLLNYSQCKLSEGDYYAVIEHCTTVLKTDPENVKALFRRAKAHVGAWNPDSAKADFLRASEIDRGLVVAVKKEMANLDEMIKAKNKCDKEKLKGLFGE